MRREAFKFWDLVHHILETLRHSPCLQLSKCVLAMWPLKSIKSYESSGRGQITIDTGRSSPAGEGAFTFKTRVGQDDMIYNAIDNFVNEQVEKRRVSILLECHWLCTSLVHTVKCCYNVVQCTVETLYSTIYYSKYFKELNFDKSTQYVALWTHKRHPIPRPFGRAMECLLWVFQQKLTVL